jgi:hypothetical protein
MTDHEATEYSLHGRSDKKTEQDLRLVLPQFQAKLLCTRTARWLALSLVAMWAVISVPGCFWLMGDKQPEGYPDADLPLFAPAELGEVSTVDLINMRTGLKEATSSDTVVAISPASATGPAIQRYQNAWNGSVAEAPYDQSREAIFPDRIEVYDGDEQAPRHIALHTPLRAGTMWRCTDSSGIETTSTITAIEDICTSRGFFPKAIRVTSFYERAPLPHIPAARLRLTAWYARGYGLVEVTDIKETAPYFGVRMTLTNIVSPVSHRLFAPPPCQPGPVDCPPPSSAPKISS